MTATSTKLPPDDLMRSVVLLTPTELSEFVLRFDEWRFRQAVQVDSKAAQIAEAHYGEGNELVHPSLCTIVPAPSNTSSACQPQCGDL